MISAGMTFIANVIGNLGIVIPPQTLEAAIANYNAVHPGDISLAADFIRTCLRLEPTERPSATDLIGHEWLCTPTHISYRPL